MTMSVKNAAAALVVACGLQVVSAGEYCYNSGSYDIEYCSSGCCGSGFDQHCCVNIAAIVGGIIGGIILISIIIAVICVCTQKNRPGRVVQPAPTAAVIMTHQQGYGHMQQQYPPIQPGGQAGNPAYPPPYPGQPQQAYGHPPNAPPPAQY